jgi:arginyl-tRNA synthetase
MKTQLEQALRDTLESLGANTSADALIKPSDLEHGDYTTNSAMVLAKQVKRNPMEIAEEISDVLHSKSDELGIGKIEVVAPGFINFWIKEKELEEKVLKQTLSIENVGKGKKVIVEYSSPNIAKPFTIGHLRSTVIGDAVANLLEAVGYTVYRDNHIGDWGTQFGKQICAIKKFGNEAEIENSDRPVKVLVDLYVKFHEEAEKNPELEDEAREWFKKLEDGDSEARRLWEKCIEWSWVEFEKIYKELGVPSALGKQFENNGRGYGEAYFEDKMGPVITELEEKGFLKEGKEGAKIVEFPGDIYPPLMILKKDGATLYATRDLATDKFRIEKYGSDVTIINEVGAEQSLQFNQLYKLEEMLGWFTPGQRVHVKHGLYRFKEGKMATRKGNVIWLEDVLAEAKERAAQLGKDSAGTVTEVAIGAIKWNDLKRSSHLDVNFDWDEILSMQGNSGPYMQYSYVRTQSIIEKAKEAQASDSEQGYTEDELLLLRILYKFSSVVAESARNYSPNTLTTYLYELAQSFNLFYQKHKVIEDRKYLQNRLQLVERVGEVIKEGLDILGIDAPMKM